ncbi:RNA polymerase sigma factor [Candidatus Parcubacteria bacterium]|nr:RNA polymerase sigma factor [Candidatus Parcubacteria bacterium]
METHKEKSDSELLALSVNHPSAFGILVDRYQKEFLRKVTFILKNKEEAEDIVQDAFVKIYTHASKFKVQEGATFKSWGYKILLNTCYTYCKKKKREQQFREYIEIDADLVFSENEFEKKFDLDQTLSIISKIPVALARMLTLTLLEGKTYEDIAEIENLTPGAVRTRMHRAKREFEKIQQEYAKP